MKRGRDRTVPPPLFWWHGAIATKFMVIRGHYMDIRVKYNVSSI